MDDGELCQLSKLMNSFKNKALKTFNMFLLVNEISMIV